MNTHPPTRRLIITYAGLYLVFAATASRAILDLANPGDLGFTVGMLAGYFLLLLLEPWLISRSPAYLHVFNTLQTLIGLALLVLIGENDFFSLLFVPPCVQSILNFPRKTAFIWIGVICLLMEIALFTNFPFSEKVGYMIIYPAAIFLFTGFGYVTLQAENAQKRSEALLADLQVANRKSQAYAAQVQELAAAEERNRLARELHDSVTQIIFGLTLSAQAARILLDRDPSRVAAQLDRLQVLAQSALTEMRVLIQQLHPRTIAEEGLAASLRRLAAERLSSDGLNVDLQINEEQRIPAKIEEELFRIAQEALNNIVKHARTDRATITLALEDGNRVVMCIEDNGAGFDPARVPSSPGHLGLTSMSERIQALGGKLVIDSKPGKGTRLNVELTLSQEVEHAG